MLIFRVTFKCFPSSSDTSIRKAQQKTSALNQKLSNQTRKLTFPIIMTLECWKKIQHIWMQKPLCVIKSHKVFMYDSSPRKLPCSKQFRVFFWLLLFLLEALITAQRKTFSFSSVQLVVKGKKGEVFPKAVVKVLFSRNLSWLLATFDKNRLFWTQTFTNMIYVAS